jgi:EAL and modified HD-GYP domain-containing signal transduction protein
MSFIVRTPLLDPQQKVLGYKLACQGPRDAVRTADLQRLAAWVARPPDDASAPPGGVAGDGVVFLQAPAGALSPEAFAGLAAGKTVLSLEEADFRVPAVGPAVKALRERGFGISLRLPKPRALPPTLVALLTHVEFAFDKEQTVARPAIAVAPGSTPPRFVADGLADWQDYQACAALGLDAFTGHLHTAGNIVVSATPGRLSPASVLVMQLIQMVQADADVRELEAALKQDAALAYRLLRCLNSASFGLGIEVQSLRHAVSMMGYRPLLRWLALLLASSSSQAKSPVLLQTAIVRGRFTELLGRGLLPAHEADNLFVVGMFSLVDRLLGVPMGQALDKIQLSGPVVQALLKREGIYGPFLRLAEACERMDADPAALADAAFVTSEQVNRAHVAALAWAGELQIA